MSEVSRPWENKRAGLQKVGEQKKCYGFQLQNNGSGRETEQRGTERECLLIILYTSKSEVDLYKIACYCNAHTGSNVILLILSMLDYFTLSLLTLKCQIPEKKYCFSHISLFLWATTTTKSIIFQLTTAFFLIVSLCQNS